MKIYLASRYSRREELLGYAKQLKTKGYEITSRWIYGNHDLSDKRCDERSLEDNKRIALEDIEDLSKAQWLISFTEPGDTPVRRGGRHVEFGFAYALELRAVIIGHRENVFHYLPMVEFFPTWTSFFYSLENAK